MQSFYKLLRYYKTRYLHHFIKFLQHFITLLQHVLLAASRILNAFFLFIQVSKILHRKDSLEDAVFPNTLCAKGAGRSKEKDTFWNIADFGAERPRKFIVWLLFYSCSSLSQLTKRSWTFSDHPILPTQRYLVNSKTLGAFSGNLILPT